MFEWAWLASATWAAITRGCSRLLRERASWVWLTSRLSGRRPRPRTASVVVAELSMGQMIDDVERAIGRRPDGLVNWLGGRAPSTEEFAARVIERFSELKPDHAIKGAVQ